MEGFSLKNKGKRNRKQSTLLMDMRHRSMLPLSMGRERLGLTLFCLGCSLFYKTLIPSAQIPLHQ